jgi:hypothetical protein
LIGQSSTAMYCFKCSEDEVKDWWKRISTGQNLMKVYVTWCMWLSRNGVDYKDYQIGTMHYYPEFIAFLTRKKLEGKYHEPI